MKLLAALDLMAAARARPVAESLGWSYVPCPREGDLVARARAEGADAVLLDLSGIPDAAAVVRSLKTLPGILVIGTAGHVEEDLLQAARAAGADALLSKGELARRLPELLGAAG